MSAKSCQCSNPSSLTDTFLPTTLSIHGKGHVLYPAAREEQFSLLGYSFALEAKLPMAYTHAQASNGVPGSEHINGAFNQCLNLLNLHLHLKLNEV